MDAFYTNKDLSSLLTYHEVSPRAVRL